MNEVRRCKFRTIAAAPRQHERPQEEEDDDGADRHLYHGQPYRDIIQQGADPDDVAVADLLVDLNIAEINRDVQELRAVQYALERIRHGTYGICASCGEPIDPERLRAVPHATLCIDCRSRAEKKGDESPSL